MPRGAAQLGGRQAEGRVLFARDARVALALLNHARYRSLERYLGIPRDQANLATLILLLMAAETLRRQVERLPGVPPAPRVEEVIINWGWARGLIWEVSGMPGKEPPLFAPMIALAIAVPPVRRVVLESLRRISGPLHRVATDFHGRYGYLVDPGHWRQRRALSKLTTEPGPSAQASG